MGAANPGDHGLRSHGWRESQSVARPSDRSAADTSFAGTVAGTRRESRIRLWLQLLDRTYTGHRIWSLLDPPDPQRVTRLADIHIRRQILEATLKRLGAKSDLPPEGSDWVFDQRLAESRWEDPLYLMMAAVVTSQPGGLPEALSIARTDLAFRPADRELDRIQKSLPAGEPAEAGELLTRLAAPVSSLRGARWSELISSPWRKRKAKRWVWNSQRCAGGCQSYCGCPESSG